MKTNKNKNMPDKTIAPDKTITQKETSEVEQLCRQNLILEEQLKAAHEQLEKQKLLIHTLESIRECVSITDMEDNLIYANDAFLKVYGYSKEEIFGKNISMIRSHINSPEVVKQILPATLKGGWQGELFNTRKNGEDFLISLNTSIVKDGDGIPIALVGAAIDITEKKAAEKLLKESEENYRSLFEEVKDVVFVSTPEGKFLEINPAGLELFGYASKEELLNSDITMTFYKDPAERQKFKETLERDGYVTNYEIQVKTRDGRQLTVLETASIKKSADGGSLLYRGILRDITPLKNAEAELKSINAAKDKFFSIIAHDLRSPFTSLIGLSGIIINDIDTLNTEEIKSFAMNINKSARQVFNLLENLLQWSRIQTGRMEFSPAKFDLYNIVEQTMSLLIGNAVKKNIDIVSEVPICSFAYGDQNMISSVIQNLTSNAIKFTHAGGKIKISISEKDKFYQVSIRDNGTGINPKDMDKLFRIDVHHTTTGTSNEKGTGLGLVLCKDLIEKNGGMIWVESKPGEGTVMHFTVPQAG